jgi:hypothetical protein
VERKRVREKERRGRRKRETLFALIRIRSTFSASLLLSPADIDDYKQLELLAPPHSFWCVVQRRRFQVCADGVVGGSLREKGENLVKAAVALPATSIPAAAVAAPF